MAAYNLACGYAKLGRKEDALRQLETAVSEGAGAGMANDSDLESLRTETRFRTLVERVAARGR